MFALGLHKHYFPQDLSLLMAVAPCLQSPPRVASWGVFVLFCFVLFCFVLFCFVFYSACDVCLITEQTLKISPGCPFAAEQMHL